MRIFSLRRKVHSTPMVYPYCHVILATTARSAGYLLGASLFPLLLLCAIGAAIAAMRKRDVSRKALLGLIFVMAAFICGSLIQFANLFLEQSSINPAQKQTVLVGVSALGGCCAILLIVAGFVLALLGVIDTYREPARFRRGRKRGYFALVLTGLMGVAMLIALVIGMRHGAELQAARLTKAGAGAITKVEEFNYQIEAPAEWGALESKKLNPLASAAYMRTYPQMFCMVIAEHHASETPVVLDSALEVIKAGLKSRGEPVFVSEKPAKIGALEGMRLETDIAISGMPFTFIHGVTVAGGNLYQIICWAPQSARTSLEAESEKFQKSFSLLDPARAAWVPPSVRESQSHRSDTYGWSVNLEGTAWTRRWERLEKDVPNAEWGVLNPTDSACFCVASVSIKQDEADPEAITHALASLVGVRYPDDDITDLSPWTDKDHPQIRGRTFSWRSANSGQETAYRVRIVHAEACSYVVAASCNMTLGKDGEAMIQDALERVRFDPSITPPLTPDPSDKRALTAQRITLNNIGVYYLNRNELESAAAWFARSYHLYKTDPTVLQNYVSALAGLDKRDEALAILKEGLSNLPGNHRLEIAMAELLALDDQVDQALQKYAEVFTSGYRDDAAFAKFVHLACDHEQSAVASTALDAYEKGHEAPRLQKLRAVILAAGGDFQAALAILDPLKKASPHDMDTLWTMSECMLGAKQYLDCIAICDQLVEARQDSAAVYYRRGLAQLGLRQMKEAKDSMEKALAKAPADPEVKRMLDHLSGQLGQGSHLAVKTLIDPIPLPELFTHPPAAERNDPYLQGFSAYYRQVSRAISYEQGREVKTTDRQSITVLDQQGVQSFKSLEFGFDPLSEELFVNSLTVKDADGKTMASGKVEDSYVVDDGNGDMATQRKVLHVPVPGVQPGCTIEVTVTKRETGAKEFGFHAHSFSKAIPVLRSILVLNAPPGATRWETSREIKSRKVGDLQTWTMDRPEVIHPEPLWTSLDKFLPLIWIGDANSTWSAETKQYLASIKDRLSITPAVRDAALAATKGKTHETEKIAALAELVQHDVTYKAIEFGRRARMPNSAEQTLQNRYGDCKDHALLLRELLQAVDIPSHLALVSTGMRIRNTLPSLDQFNHMIVYIPASKGAGAAFIDCTTKSVDPSAGDPPQGLAKQQALILDEAKPRLETIPDYSRGSSKMKLDREISVLEGGTDLAVKESLTFTGLMAAGMRDSLAEIQPANRKRALLQMLNSTLPALDLKEAEVDHLDDHHVPLVIRVSYLLKQKCQVVGSQLIGQIPAAWERMFLAPMPVEKRHTPFRIWAPNTIECTVSIKPPAGWKPAAPEKHVLDNPFCTGNSTAQLDRETLRLACHLDQRAGEFPATQYSAYTDAMTEGIALVERNFVFQKL